MALQRSKIITDLIQAVSSGYYYKAVCILSKTETITATRRRYKGKIFPPVEILVTVGKPNYKIREYINKNRPIKYPHWIYKEMLPRKRKG